LLTIHLYASAQGAVEPPRIGDPGKRQAAKEAGMSVQQAPSQPVRPDLGIGLHHHLAGRLADAEYLYRAFLAVDPNNADGLHLLGVLAHQTGRTQLAVELIRAAIAVNPGVAGYHCNLGVALGALGHLTEAIEAYQAAVERQPDLAEAVTNMGALFAELGRLDEALALHHRAIDLSPDLAVARNNMGNVRLQQGHLDDAVGCFRSAARCSPDSLEAHCNLGVTLQLQGRMDEAIAAYRTALDLRRDHPEAHFFLATALLASGDLAAGWQEFEWRCRTKEGIAAHRQTASLPQWRGEAAAGRTLVIHAEGGLGDTIQFCRYAKLAAARGLRVVLAIQPPLIRLLQTLDAVDLVVAGAWEPDGCDLYCPMLSLPFALGTTLANIPSAASYLHADAAQAEAWRARLADTAPDCLRVGLVWAGNPRSDNPGLAAVDRKRSLAPERLAPLFDVPGLHVFSLQKDGPRAPEDFPLADYMDEMEDFADTASLIANLDLVISVDTSVAHLAAALGKPVWLLERFDSCWRWLVGRRDSPWYPTIRLYRQPHPGHWDQVVTEVTRDLHRLAAGQGRVAHRR
jgi:tetratricopeptide (TPR) repeat protein